VTEAWLTCAPKRVAREYLAGLGGQAGREC
jgi:hypothetical protein